MKNNILNNILGGMIMCIVVSMLIAISGCGNRFVDIISEGKITAKRAIATDKSPIEGSLPCKYTIVKYQTRKHNHFIGEGIFGKFYMYIYADSSFGDIGDIVGYTNNAYCVIQKHDNTE